MTAVDRNDRGWEPRFDKDYEYGRQGEMWIEDVAEALRTERAEVKRDGRFSVTGNLYVEYECKRRDGWHPSGIATTEAEVWVFVLGESRVAVVIETDVLRELCQRPDIRRAEETDGSHPTKGYLMPLTYVMAHCRVRKPVRSDNQQQMF